MNLSDLTRMQKSTAYFLIGGIIFGGRRLTAGASLETALWSGVLGGLVLTLVVTAYVYGREFFRGRENNE